MAHCAAQVASPRLGCLPRSIERCLPAVAPTAEHLGGSEQIATQDERRDVVDGQCGRRVTLPAVSGAPVAVSRAVLGDPSAREVGPCLRPPHPSLGRLSRPYALVPWAAAGAHTLEAGFSVAGPTPPLLVRSRGIAAAPRAPSAPAGWDRRAACAGSPRRASRGFASGRPDHTKAAGGTRSPQPQPVPVRVSRESFHRLPACGAWFRRGRLTPHAEAWGRTRAHPLAPLTYSAAENAQHRLRRLCRQPLGRSTPASRRAIDPLPAYASLKERNAVMGATTHLSVPDSYLHHLTSRVSRGPGAGHAGLSGCTSCRARASARAGRPQRTGG